MRFAAYAGEASPAELIRRHYEVAGRGSAARAKELEAALLRANPHLRNLERVPPGTPILLPDSAELRPAAEAPLVAPALVEGVMGQLHRALDGLRGALAASAEHEAKAANDTAELLRSRELRAGLRKDEALSAHLAETEQAARERLKEADLFRAVQDQALAQATLDLELLRQRFAAAGDRSGRQREQQQRKER